MRPFPKMSRERLANNKRQMLSYLEALGESVLELGLENLVVLLSSYASQIRFHIVISHTGEIFDAHHMG